MSVPSSNASGETADLTVETELKQLAVMPIAQLRIRYREVLRTDPPGAFGPDLLRRSIAHRIQAKAFGDLSRSAQHLLDQMVKVYIATPGGKIVLPRRIKPGSVLLREWNGRSYRVMVQADGFAYDGKTFGNLSEIASLITGVRWNGPRFFGLRSKAQDAPLPLDSGRASSTSKKGPRPTVHLKLGGGSDYRKLKKNQFGKVVSGGNRHGL
jgi:Protein of unknown function (DUF2924)